MLDFYTAVQNFFVNNAYTFEFILAIGLFCHFYERRKYFPLRFLLCLTVMLVFSLLWNVWKTWYGDSDWMTVLYNIVKYIGFFLLGLGAACFCTKTSLYRALFGCIGAVATQHFSYRVYAVILVLLRLPFASIAAFFIDLGVIAVVYTSVYFIFVERVKRQADYCFENKANVALGGLLILFAIVFQFIIEPFVDMNEQSLIFVFLSFYDLLCCVFTLMVEYGTFNNTKLVNENSILEQLMHKQEEQYRMTKDNIDMINIKCHDMKHQLSVLAKEKDLGSVSELENIIKIYDTSLQTGNEILDVFLADKKLQCERNDIHFECIVNGACLSFMSSADIFSLFGNALDNAIEALRKIENKEKRAIGMTVKESLGMAVIHIENYYKGNLVFQSDLPETTKEDKYYHGFGLRSIKMIAEKYGGNMSILTEKDIFNLNIILPIPPLAA